MQRDFFVAFFLTFTCSHLKVRRVSQTQKSVNFKRRLRTSVAVVSKLSFVKEQSNYLSNDLRYGPRLRTRPCGMFSCPCEKDSEVTKNVIICICTYPGPKMLSFLIQNCGARTIIVIYI